MTIMERKAREAHDRENPWRSMSNPPPVGLLCDLLLGDLAGHFPDETRHYFLHSDGSWYRVDPASKLHHPPLSWRPAYVFMSPEKRHVIKRRADVSGA